MIKRIGRIYRYLRYIKKECFSVEGEVFRKFQNEEAKNRLIEYCDTHSEMDIYQREVNYLRYNYPKLMFCDENAIYFSGKNPGFINEIFYDKEKRRFYADRNGKRLYFHKKIQDYRQALAWYEELVYEQSATSAHLYLEGEFNIKEGDIIADIGAAEGIVALDYIEIVNHAYLFECDREWMETLKITFAPWKDKVTIVPKYVCDKEDEDSVTLDSFFSDKKVDFLKMDIEGAELSALDGAKELIKGDKPLKVAVCAYHKEKDEDEIKKRLTNFQITTLTGWMFASYNYPYFRRGIIRAKKMINESI